MEFRIEISHRALTDAAEYVAYIREIHKEPEAAARWFRGLIRAVHSLENRPQRCSLIPKRAAFRLEIRHLIYHTHRIIFGIEKPERKVMIYRVYHGSRRPLSADDPLSFD